MCRDNWASVAKRARAPGAHFSWAPMRYMTHTLNCLMTYLCTHCYPIDALLARPLPAWLCTLTTLLLKHTSFVGNVQMSLITLGAALRSIALCRNSCDCSRKLLRKRSRTRPQNPVVPPAAGLIKKNSSSSVLPLSILGVEPKKVFCSTKIDSCGTW